MCLSVDVAVAINVQVCHLTLGCKNSEMHREVIIYSRFSVCSHAHWGRDFVMIRAHTGDCFSIRKQSNESNYSAFPSTVNGKTSLFCGNASEQQSKTASCLITNKKCTDFSVGLFCYKWGCTVVACWGFCFPTCESGVMWEREDSVFLQSGVFTGDLYPSASPFSCRCTQWVWVWCPRWQKANTTRPKRLTFHIREIKKASCVCVCLSCHWHGQCGERFSWFNLSCFSNFFLYHLVTLRWHISSVLNVNMFRAGLECDRETNEGLLKGYVCVCVCGVSWQASGQGPSPPQTALPSA